MTLTKVHNRMILGSVVNVLDKGADPTGVEDSTSAIQAAIDAAEVRPSSGQSSTVYAPAGNYKITNTITINKDINFCGDGGDATIFNLSVSTAKEAFRVEPAPGGYIWFASLSGFRVNCKAGAVAGDGILMTATAPSAISQSAIRDIQIRDHRDGITLAGISANEVYINTVENVKILGAALSGAGANDVRYGLKVSTAAYNTFRNVEITGIGNAGYAVFAEGAGSHFEHITTDGVSYIDCPWGVVDHWSVETIIATTPVSDTVVRVNRLSSLRSVVLIEVENAKCTYGIGIVPGSQGMTISDVTVVQSSGARPNYPLTIPPGSKGAVINWKGAGAFKVELYTDAGFMEDWRFINSLDITDREVGVRNVAAGAKPTASDDLRGQLVLEKNGAGVADVVYVCRKNASEVYEWHAIY